MQGMLASTGLKISLLVTISLLSQAPAPVYAGETPIDCAGVLPPSVRKILETEFALWRLKQLSDLGPEDRKQWLKAHGAQWPGIAVGHFQRADKLSYAVLLVRRPDPKDGFKVVIFTANPRTNGENSMMVDQSDNEPSAEIVLSTAPPGKYPSFDGLKSVTIRRDGLYVEVMERGLELYFWSGDKYDSIQLWR